MNESNQNRPQDDQIKGVRRMLARIAELAEQASLTGSFEKGAGISLQQYNAAVKLLEQTGAIPAGFFFTLLEGVSFDEIGVASAQLASYLGSGKDSGEGNVTYHGPKYAVERNNEPQFSREELSELRELLRQNLAK